MRRSFGGVDVTIQQVFEAVGEHGILDNAGFQSGRENAFQVLARSEGIERAELSAQEYVVPFYARAGFRIDGEAYEEAGIPHRKMSREL